MSVAPPSNAEPFSTLYREHHGWLYQWLRGKLGCNHGAADLAHDTFVRLLSARPGEAIREPRAYLHTLANGLLVNHWRRLALERSYVAELAARPELVAPSEEQLALVCELLFQLDQMLDRLAPRARQAFLLAQFEGLGYAQIALQLGVSERMVKKYMAQAMLHCALIIDGDDT